MGTFPPSSVKDEVIKYASRGILLDTNVLLVCVVGRMDPDRIEKFKNTNTFTRKDYEFLEVFLRLFSKIAVTPHILTEVSNLAGQLTDPAKSHCFDSFARDIKVFHEGAETAASICVTPLFRRLGITDAGIALIAKGNFLGRYESRSADSVHVFLTHWKISSCDSSSWFSRIPRGTAPCLVLTADLNLYDALLKSGVDAINYNHIRPIG